MIISAPYDDSLRNVFRDTKRLPKQYYQGPFSTRMRHLLVDHILRNLTFVEYDVQKAEIDRKSSILFRSHSELDSNSDILISSLSFENEIAPKNPTIVEEEVITTASKDESVLEKYGVSLDIKNAPSPETSTSRLSTAMTKSSVGSTKSQASAEQKLIMSKKPKKKPAKKKVKKEFKKLKNKVNPDEDDDAIQHYKGSFLMNNRTFRFRTL